MKCLLEVPWGRSIIKRGWNRLIKCEFIRVLLVNKILLSIVDKVLWSMKIFLLKMISLSKHPQIITCPKNTHK